MWELLQILLGIVEGKENSIKYYFRTIFDFPPNELPQLLDKLKMEIQTDIIVLFGVYKDKISVVAGVTKDRLEKISAIEIITVSYTHLTLPTILLV